MPIFQLRKSSLSDTKTSKFTQQATGLVFQQVNILIPNIFKH